jgi:hypothetical protein
MKCAQCKRQREDQCCDWGICLACAMANQARIDQAVGFDCDENQGGAQRYDGKKFGREKD